MTGIMALYLVISPSSLFCSDRPSESALMFEMSNINSNKNLKKHYTIRKEGIKNRILSEPKHYLYCHKPVRDELVKLLNQPLHILSSLLDIITDGVEVILFSFKILKGRDSLEHPGQAGVNAVHPLDHGGKLLLVHAPLLGDLLELVEQRVDPGHDGVPVVLVPGIALLQRQVLRHLLGEGPAQSGQVLKTSLNLLDKRVLSEELAVLIENLSDIIIVVEGRCLIGNLLLNILDIFHEGVFIKSELHLHHMKWGEGLNVIPFFLQSFDVTR